MQKTMENWNADIIEPYGFTICNTHSYNKSGRCWKLSPELGEGFFWAYGEKDLFDIKIHDFYYHKDTLVESKIPGYLSISYYDSISGEQLTPYRRINAGCIQSVVGSDEPYKIWIHKNIPVRSIGIGISPAYYEEYMRALYQEEYSNPYTAFAMLNQEAVFPELVVLLKQVENYHGDGIAAKLFYSGKVAEVVSMLFTRLKNQKKEKDIRRISEQDIKQIELAASYINDHYAREIPLEHLAGFACMSLSKFKNLFQKVYNCSVTGYIQQRRLSHAECLLAESDLTIGQIAKSVGYSTSSRLAVLFRESTGLTPIEYRKMTLKHDTANYKAGDEVEK